MNKTKTIILTAVLFLTLGFFLGSLFPGSDKGSSGLMTKAAVKVAGSISERRGLDMRNRVVLENPALLRKFAGSGGFGGEFSRVIGLNMFSASDEIIDEARSKTKIEEISHRTWIIYMPFVNSILFETDEGLVLIDTGVASAGPGLYEAIRSVSDKAIHTIIYTHGHVDHAYGTWAIMDAGENPEIIAHKNIEERFQRYIKTRGSLAKYMSQPLEQMPDSEDDMIWPDRTFDDELRLTIGGEEFVLRHFRGETDDQLYVWVPGRKVLCPADYYQGFLPNGGNGKRVQRYIEEWAEALGEMSSLNAEYLLPSHGTAIKDKSLIHHNLSILSRALEHIASETIRHLNSGLRKDLIPSLISLPPELEEEETLRESYVSVQDISRMVIKQYTGWWDDQPSHWNRPPLEAEAALIRSIAGGMDPLIQTGLTLIEEDIALASVVADWAWLDQPGNPAVQDMVIRVYTARILNEAVNTQERLAYLDRIVEVREIQLNE